jgi:hypothetical protein
MPWIIYSKFLRKKLIHARQVIKASKPRRYQVASRALHPQLRGPLARDVRGGLLALGQAQISHRYGTAPNIQQRLANEQCRVMEVHIEDME